MSIDPGDGLLASFGLKLVNLVVGAVCSFSALRFFDGLSLADKWCTFLGGWALAAWGAEPLSAFMDLPSKVEIGVVILLALFGMAFAAEIMKIIRGVSWGEFIKDVLERVTGKGKGKQ